MWAMGSYGLPVVQLLVESGADVNARNDDGETALFILARGGGLEDEPILEYLCQHGLDVNIADNAGKYPSIRRADALCAFSRVLIRAGIRYVPADSHSLFMKAIDSNDSLIVEHLLSQGAETEWDEERQGEDQFGRYSVNDHHSMLTYAKARKADGVAKLLMTHLPQRS